MAVVVALALALGACGKSSPPKVASARQLATVIADHGAACTDYAATPAVDSVGAVGDDGVCTVGGRPVRLAVFQSTAERDRGAVELLKGCIAKHSFQPTSTATYSMLRGPTWLVLATDNVAAQRVGKVLHVGVQQAPC